MGATYSWRKPRAQADAVGLLQHRHRLGRPFQAQQAQRLGLQDLGGGGHVAGPALQLGLDQLLGHLAAAGLGPDPQAHAVGLGVADGGAVGVQALGRLAGGAQVAQAVLAEGDVPGGGVDLPAVAGPFQQPHGLPALLDAGLEARGAVEHHAVEVQRLALAPDVAQRPADGQRLLGVGDAPLDPGQHRHHRGVFGVGLGQLGRGRVALGQVHLAQVGPGAGHLAPPEPVGVGQPAEQAHHQQLLLGAGALRRPPADVQPGQQGVQRLARAPPCSTAGTCPRCPRGTGRRSSRRPRSSASRRLLHVAALERQVAQLGVQPRPLQVAVAPGCARRRELGLGVLVVARAA